MLGVFSFIQQHCITNLCLDDPPGKCLKVCFQVKISYPINRESGFQWSIDHWICYLTITGMIKCSIWAEVIVKIRE